MRTRREGELVDELLYGLFFDADVLEDDYGICSFVFECVCGRRQIEFLKWGHVHIPYSVIY